MNTVTANDDLQALLSRIREVAEIRDAGGNLLGYFTPSAEAEKIAYERASRLFDPTEMKRRAESSQPGRTIDQIMERLKALEER